jgi:hypothetical protein
VRDFEEEHARVSEGLRMGIPSFILIVAGILTFPFSPRSAQWARLTHNIRYKVNNLEDFKAFSRPLPKLVELGFYRVRNLLPKAQPLEVSIEPDQNCSPTLSAVQAFGRRLD